jgi:uncharacterized protein (DUF849 family)
MNLKNKFQLYIFAMAIDIISNWTWCVAIGRNTKAFEASAILVGLQLSQHYLHV